MTRAIIAAALMTIAALPGPLAAQDPRLVERDYDPAEIVTIEGKVNVQATIRFAPGESVQNIAIGDSQKWQVTPSRNTNLIFLKPLAERATTNMTVVTNRRVYLFDLVASPTHRNPLYVLNFTYTQEFLVEAELPQPEEDAVETASALELAAANDDIAVIDPSSLNFAWSGTGDAVLLPAEIYDNGDATFLTWPLGTPVPAILVKNEAGTEGPVNYAVRGDVIVIDQVPGEIILRSGDDYARIVNSGPQTELAGG